MEGSGAVGPASRQLEVCLLGALIVRRAGQPIALGPRLQRALLALLAVDAGRVLSIDRLIDLLWGEEPPPAATASLQAYVSQLRRLLEPDRPPRAPATVLRTQEPGYVLELGADAVDATSFRRLAAAGRHSLAAGDPSAALAHLDAALGLWRGTPLGEFASEPWALPLVSQLLEDHEALLEDRADTWLAQGRHAEAVGELEAMVVAQPFRERRWAQLMVALYRAGRQADALRTYARCRRQLTDELGIEPGSELRRLEHAILGHDPTLELALPAAWPGTATGAAGGVVTAPSGPAPAPATAPGLVGREEHLRRVSERLAELPGRGGAVILVGEPGVGKTVLAEEAASLGRAAGAMVAWARCIDPDAAPAFWPWVELLRALPPGLAVDAALDHLRGETGSARAAEANAFGTYEVVLSALREAVAAQPVFAVIDDLHAADASSLKLLETIGGDLHRLGALFVLTLRDTEETARLSGALGELLRHRGVEQLSVPCLDHDGVTRMAQQFAGHGVNDAFGAALYERTSGNPFYVGELLRLLRSERGMDELGASDVSALDVPSGVRDVIDRRLTRLPLDTRSLLSIAAVTGRTLDLDLLEHVGSIDAEQLMLALEPAIAAGLLVERAETWGYEFRHALIRESLYAGLGRLGRARLHARTAASIEQLGGTSSREALAALAHHQLAAGPFGDPAKALDFSRRAAGWAMRQSAWADAVGHLRQALEVAAHGRGADEARADILVELGGALRAEGNIPAAHAALYEAIDVADRLGDEDRLLVAAVAFGEVSLWGARPWGEPDLRLVGLLERQLGRPDLDDTRRARLLARLSLELYHGQRHGESWRSAQEALSISRHLNDKETYGMAVVAALRAGDGPDHRPECQALIEEVVTGPGPGVAPAVEAVARANRFTFLLRAGDIAAFDAEFSRVRELAAELRSRELEAQLLIAEGCREMVLGRAAEVLSVFERGYALLTELSDNWKQPTYFIAQVSIYMLCGELSRHIDELEAQIDHPEHPSLPPLAAPAAALAHVQAGDPDAARAIADRAFAPPHRIWTWMLPVALWAQVAAQTGAPAPEWLYEQLLPFSGELALAGIGVDFGGAVDSLLAGLAARTGRYEDALAHARRGLALERRAGARAWVGRTAKLLAELESSSASAGVAGRQRGGASASGA